MTSRALTQAPPDGARLADAWDEGWFAAREFYVKAESPEDGIESNPYRSAK